MSQAARGTPDDGWDEWGPVYDRQATIGVITALQSDGLRVRVVKEASCNRIYTQKPDA